MKIALSLLFLMAMTEYSQQQDAETNDAKNGHDIQYQTNELHYACGSKGICRCNETRKGYLIDCSRRELHNLSLVIPSNVTLANFSINYLTLIPKDTFRLTTSLIMINISRNNISELYEETFHYTTQLKTLDINDNLLTQLPTNIFQKLVHLSVLRLSHNYIKELPEDIFNGNSNLNLLKLSFNRLRLLPEGLFTKTKSLIVLDLSFNNLTSLPKGLFDNTTSLKALFINNNNISYMPPDCFRKLEALGDLVLHENKLTVLSKTMFAENVRLRNLDLCDNNIARPTADFFPETKKLKLVSNSITHIPDGMFQYFKNLSQIYLSKNRIESLSNNAFLGLNCVYHLTLYGNNLSSLPAGLFKTTNLTFSLDLSNNSLSVIPRGLFSAYGRNHGMLILQLQRNNLTELRNDTFLGLGSLAYLILSRNRIHSIAERAFLGTHLKCIYLIANNISNVSNNSFALENIDIHLYKNNILNISQVALNGVGNESILYMNCNQLGKLPSSTNDNIICVNDESYPSLILNSTFQRLASSFEMQGFECKNIGKGKNECRPCPTGTHGGGFLKKCIECPKGGFYQDEIGSTDCKTCNDGNFVEKGSGSSLVQCEVCPEGTDKNLSAGYRACVCKENYARKHRFEECFLCIADGLNCSEDYISILPGFYWNWSFPNTKPDQYLDFVKNLQTKTDDYDNTTIQYEYSMPFVYLCPRKSSCDSKNGLPMYDDDNCAAGYTGWMCSKCRSGYYSVLSFCHPCPSKLWVLVVFLFVVLSCVALLSFIVWKKNKINNQRSVIDKLSSRIKIVLGFYQVIGDLFETFHNVKWQGPFLIFGEFLSMVVADFLQVFVRPQCINEQFEINPLLQFKIVLIFPVVLVTTYLCLRCTVYFKLKFGFFSLTVRKRAKQTVSKLFTLVVLLLFVTYTPTCNSIFALYPAACSEFKIYSVGNESITLLRADYGINCKDLDSYHVAAYIATVVYVFGFPFSLLIFLRKHLTKGGRATGSADLDFSHDDSFDENSPLVNGNEKGQCDSPVWVNFLCENYKSQFWYWEIIELTRKVTQTVMVTLLGWHNSLTQLSTIGMSVLFLTLHAKYSPMKNKFEQRLQLFSLAVILINIMIVSVPVSSEYGVAIYTGLFVLDIFIIFIVSAEALVPIIRFLARSLKR